MPNSPWAFSLNTSTIRNDESTVLDYIDIAVEAGYQGIEPWVAEIDAWTSSGATVEAIRDHANDRGIQIVNLIAFFEWAVPEPDRRKVGLSEARRCFEMAQILNCPFVATAPSGIHDRIVDLGPVAHRFKELTDSVADLEPVPLLEFWGIAKTLGTVGEILHVAAESGASDVKMLADIFHMYKGTGHHTGFEHFGPDRLGLIHVNDYPANPARAEIQDEDRVFTGDGIAPWSRILDSLEKTGYSGMMSLELFNPEYWSRGPEAVAREGMAKMRKCLAR